ncbi:MAG TPA: hypothetical protein GXX18_12345 [Bacillales bacterium]|nr:hypothetical protein [Bacillales bacterium]
MKETHDTEEFDNVLNAIENLNEEDAKGFLKIIFGKLNIFEKGNGTFSNDQLIKEVSSIYNQKIPKTIEIREKQKEKNS